MAFEVPIGDATVENGRYRYLTCRAVAGGDPGRALCVVPSRPPATPRDLRPLEALAGRLGCGRLLVAPAFALVAADLGDLATDGDPVGPDADAWIAAAVAAAGGVAVCAWGAGGSLLERDGSVLRLLAESGSAARCLGTDRHGFPLTPAKWRENAPIPYHGRFED